MRLEIHNMKGFIHKNGIEWMTYLNFYIKPFKLIEMINTSALSSGFKHELTQTRVLVTIVFGKNSDYYSVAYFPLID
jgi:hypothetical protein